MILRTVILQTILFPGSDQCERLLICPAFVFLRNAMQREMRARLDSLPRTEASFIEPMECGLVSKLPEGSDWTYEVKLDGYRAMGVKTSREAIIYSRNCKNFNKRYPYIAEALGYLPADTVIDGEIVAL